MFPLTFFFSQYNKPWLEAAIQRGDDIVFATKPLFKSDYIKNNVLQGAFAYELEFLAKRNVKPSNLSFEEWVLIKSWFGY